MNWPDSMEAGGMGHERYHVANLEMSRSEAISSLACLHRLNNRPFFGATIGHVKIIEIYTYPIEDSDDVDVRICLVYQPDGFSQEFYRLDYFGFLDHLPIPNVNEWIESQTQAWEKAS